METWDKVNGISRISGYFWKFLLYSVPKLVFHISNKRLRYASKIVPTNAKVPSSNPCPNQLCASVYIENRSILRKTICVAIQRSHIVVPFDYPDSQTNHLITYPAHHIPLHHLVPLVPAPREIESHHQYNSRFHSHYPHSAHPTSDMTPY